MGARAHVSFMSQGELSSEPFELVVADDAAGQRLDVYLATQFPRYSRVHLRRAINAGGVTVEGRRTKAAYHLHAGEKVVISLPELPKDGPVAENIPLDVLYEDDSLVAINKPPAMVVHPAKGHWAGTLTSALAYHFTNLSTAGGPTRPGIVHRLDRDTSGVIVIAKNNRVHLALAKQFEERTTEKEYFAIVAGRPDRDRDIVEQPIGVHPYHREKMAVRAGHRTTRDARTFYEVIERFDGFAALRVLPKTGRTHQIRVHLGYIGCPVLCDRLYGGRAQITRGEISRHDEDEHVLLGRLALHARRLRLVHPETNEPIEFEAPMPEDMAETLEALRTCRTPAT